MARFPIKRLRDLTDEPAFSRGEDYFRRGKVSIFSADAAGVLAEVRGTETYRVHLTAPGKAFGGDCTCPAFDREGWCKHLVATALAANAAGDDLPDRRAPIRAHLLGLGAAALADMLLDLAWKDAALLRKLDLAARGAAATPADQAALLQEQLRDALAEGCDADYGYTGDWLEDVEAVIEQLPALIERGGAAAAKTMIDAILDDLPDALETLEDNSQPGFDLLDRAVALHLDACRALGPEPLALAQEVFEREADGDGFEAAADRYADILGETGLAEYRRLAEAALARLPPAIRGGFGRADIQRPALVRILDRFAEREGDLDRRIALRRGEARDARSCLALARFCLEQGRPDLALQAAEDAAWLHAEDWDAEALTLFLAERLVAAGRQADAVAALWRRFEAHPSAGIVAALRARAGPDAMDRALDLLRRGGKPRRKGIVGAATDQVPLQLEILSGAGRLAEAWALARQHTLPDHILLDLAKVSEAALPAEAAVTYRMLAERQIGLTNRHGYEAACRLLGRLAAIEPQPAHRAFVVELRQRHKAKRSLLPLLDRHLAGL